MFRGSRLTKLIRRYLDVQDIGYVYGGYDSIYEDVERAFETYVKELETENAASDEREKIEAIVMDLLKREKLVKGK
jgi:hypothetical protein